MLLKTKQDIDEFVKWIQALDSDDFKQGYRYLQVEDTYCCLGVACRVLIPKSKLRLYNDNKQLIGTLPITQDSAPLWLREIPFDFRQKTRMSLTLLNDAEGFSFSEIATILELVYIHKAFD